MNVQNSAEKEMSDMMLAVEKEVKRLQEGWLFAEKHANQRQATLKEKIRSLEAQIVHMEQTRSWRWTQPLRILGAMFRKKPS